MARRTKKGAGEQVSTNKDRTPRPVNGEEMNLDLREQVALGAGSRFGLVEKEQPPAAHIPMRGLLPVPFEVEDEIKRQEGKHRMTPEYRKNLRDRLTLGHYFSDVEVAFRRTSNGIEVLAAGLGEIAEFRRTSTRGERQGVIYGVG
jgi:hypothetical protein